MLRRASVRLNGEIALTDRSPAFAWYELLTTDAAAARDFYRRVVGWQVQDASTAAFAYSVFSVDDTEVGGLMELPPEGRRMGATPRWVGYVAVDDVDAAVERLRRLGGSIYVPPTDSNIGRVSIVADPQMANLGMIGGLKRGGPPPDPDQPGRVGWHELFAADSKKALAFYSEMFGWKAAATENDLLDSYQLLSIGERTIGGMFNKLPRVPLPFWLYYFNVADIAVAVARVRQAGGRVVQGPMPVLDGVWIVRCIDPQGAMFSLQGKTTERGIEPAATSELNWAADWGGFASRGKVIARPKRS